MELREKIADPENIGTAIFHHVLHIQLEKLSEEQLIDTNEESGYNERMKELAKNK